MRTPYCLAQFSHLAYPDAVAVSILDVAQRAGVSHSTVSRVINNRPGVSAEATQRVHEAMRDLGYTHREKRPGRKPKAHAAVGTGLIGLVMSGADVDFKTSPVAASVFHAAERRLTSLGYDLLVTRLEEGGKLSPTIERGVVDGLLLYGHPPPLSIGEKLRLRPSVWLLSERAGSGYWGDRVGPDNQAVGVAAAEYLASRGRTRVVCVEVQGAHRGFSERASAFRDSAAGLGLEVETVSGSESDAESIASELVALRDGLTGAFIPRDRLTAKVLASLARRDAALAVALDVVSCDNDGVLDGLPRRPATLDIRADVIGERAVDQLLWRIEHPTDAMRSLLTVEPMLIAGTDLP